MIALTQARSAPLGKSSVLKSPAHSSTRSANGDVAKHSRAIGITCGRSKMMARDCGSAFSQAVVHDPDAPPDPIHNARRPGGFLEPTRRLHHATLTCIASMNDTLSASSPRDARPRILRFSRVHCPRQSRPVTQAVRLVTQHGHDALRKSLTQKRSKLRRNRVPRVLLDDHFHGCQRVEQNRYRTQITTGSGGNFPRRSGALERVSQTDQDRTLWRGGREPDRRASSLKSVHRHVSSWVESSY